MPSSEGVAGAGRGSRCADESHYYLICSMRLLIQAFERVAREHASRIAIWSRGGNDSVTFAALAESSNRLARVLPVEPSRPVAMALANGIGFVELFIALRHLEVPGVLLDSGLPASEKENICRRLGVGTILHEGEEGEAVRGRMRIWRLAGVEPATPPPGTALVKISSGTTGEPLGACFTEEALLTGIDQIGQGMELSADDRVLIVIPLSHAFGFDNGVLSLVVLGTPLVMAPSHYPASMFDALVEGDVTFFPVVPPLVRPLAGVPWPAIPLRRVICAGGPLAPGDARAFLNASGRPIQQFYGTTESGGITFERHPEDPDAEGTVGHTLPGVTVRLDPDGGRVRVQSSANYLGYLGKDLHTAGPRIVLTGDSAEWTEAGRLRLTGRTAELLNVGGKKVAASKLEHALRAFPGVRDAAVVGVEDSSRGDRIVAFVVSDRAIGYFDTASLGVREVRQIESLPYTERGKLDRRRLRDLASTPRS